MSRERNVITFNKFNFFLDILKFNQCFEGIKEIKCIQEYLFEIFFIKKDAMNNDKNNFILVSEK